MPTLLRTYASLVKFSHTVFALPFALVGLFLGFYHGGSFSGWKLAGVLVCMVSARSAAMAFNRWADRRYDALNRRTAVREIPSGALSARAALVFTVLSCVVFMAASFLLNPLCGWLSPVALLVVLGYSYTKRFTPLCHLVLGLGLGLAPVGAYLAATGYFSPIIIVLGAAVLTWVAGFDIIYALQDEQFDRSQGLFSIPAWLGGQRALAVSTGLHVLSAMLLLTLNWLLPGQLLLWAGTGLFLALLVYQHTLVKPHDLSRVNLAFFTTNGLGSVVFGALAVADILLLH